MADHSASKNDTSGKRDEHKARMAKTQFTFWNNKEDTGMKTAKTLYTSEIDK